MAGYEYDDDENGKQWNRGKMEEAFFHSIVKMDIENAWRK